VEEESKMSQDEFVLMLKLLKRFASTEMDQFALFKFDTSFSKIYVNMSMCPPVEGTEDMYSELSHLLEQSNRSGQSQT